MNSQQLHTGVLRPLSEACSIASKLFSPLFLDLRYSLLHTDRRLIFAYGRLRAPGWETFRWLFDPWMPARVRNLADAPEVARMPPARWPFTEGYSALSQYFEVVDYPIPSPVSLHNYNINHSFLLSLSVPTKAAVFYGACPQIPPTFPRASLAVTQPE